MKAVIFALSRYVGCQGVQAVLAAGYEIAAITHADNPAENTFWLRLPAGARQKLDSGLCAG